MSGLENIIILPKHMHIVLYMYIARRMKSKLIKSFKSHKVIFLHESHDVFINYVMDNNYNHYVTKMVKDREYLHLHCITED